MAITKNIKGKKIVKKAVKKVTKKTSNKQPERTGRNNGGFFKGVSGNPKGRPPKGYSIAERMREMFKENPEFKDAIIKSMVTAAVRGKDVQAAKYLSSYIDGLPIPMEKTNDTDILKTQHFNDLADAIKKAL